MTNQTPSVSGGGSSSAEVARLRYDHTIRALDRHTVVLSELRDRASIVLSATGIVASLFAPHGLTDPHPAGCVAAALLAAGSGLLCCIAVIWPVHDTGTMERQGNARARLRQRPRAWKVTLGRFELGQLPWDSGEVAVLDAMVDALDPARLVNYRTIKARTRIFNAACVLLPVQIAFWVLVILF